MTEKEPKRAAPRQMKLFTKPSLTRASEMPATDLNNLVAKYERAGGLPPSRLQFGDVSDVPKDRLEAMTRINDAAAAFSELPFKVRQAVNHDPRLLEQWIVSNPDLARQYGLLSPVQDTPTPPENPTSSGTEEGKKGKAEKPDPAPQA